LLTKGIHSLVVLDSSDNVSSFNYEEIKNISDSIFIDKLEKEIHSIKIRIEALKNEENKDLNKIEELEKEVANKQEVLSLKLNKWLEEKNSILKVKELKEKLDILKSEADKKERESDFQEVARLRYGEIPKVQTELNELNEKLEKIKNEGSSYLKDKVDIEDIADIISKWSGVPV
jgi:ATP-dependent Clp protease ATP-binding subunit ClpB